MKKKTLHLTNTVLVVLCCSNHFDNKAHQEILYKKTYKKYTHLYVNGYILFRNVFHITFDLK